MSKARRGPEGQAAGEATAGPARGVELASEAGTAAPKPLAFVYSESALADRLGLTRVRVREARRKVAAAEWRMVGSAACLTADGVRLVLRELGEAVPETNASGMTVPELLRNIRVSDHELAVLGTLKGQYAQATVEQVTMNRNLVWARVDGEDRVQSLLVPDSRKLRLGDLVTARRLQTGMWAMEAWVGRRL